MPSDYAIQVNNVSKAYRLYNRNSDRIKETFHPLRKRYHRLFPALKNISFSVGRSESIGIIGKNGSGKSTLLQVLCGVLQPSEGQIAVSGRISALLELGAGFNPEFTGRENVYLSATIMGLSRGYIEANLERIFAFADIGEYIDQPVKLYSSGMFVRLAFATAISIDPDILVVDEALAVGDIFFQQKCMKHMKRVMETKTIVLVSHDMHAVSTLCDRVLVLDEGSIIFDGTTSEGIALYTRLLHTEMFGGDQPKKPGDASLPPDIRAAAKWQAPDFDQWIPVSSESRGGAGDVTIHAVSITKGDEVFKLIEPGEQVTIRMLISSQRPLDEVIFGYTIKDRMGIGVFGENSVSLLAQPPSLQQGYTLVRFAFSWPEVSPQEYTLTIGIGEGSHPFDHAIQCWAHNIASLTALTPGRYVHGLFNNELDLLDLTFLQE